MSVMNLVKLISAYTVIALFSISVVILLIIIIHLCTKLKQKRKNKSKQRELQFFLLVTIVAIVCFEITLLLVIAVVLQIILIDTHALHEEHWMDHVYYASFEYLEYSIAIFDTLGHLCVILVFIARFQITFQKNTLFHSQKTLITILYSCLTILFIAAVIIVILIFIKHTVKEIIMIEIVWEILVDIMCLWILYLFMSKLYQLLQLSIQSHMRADSKKTLLKQIIEATKQSITESKSEHSKSGSKNRSTSSKKRRKNKSNKSKEKSAYTMTIDGIKIKPHSSNGSKPNSRNNSPDPSPEPDNEQTECKSHYHSELTVTVITKANSQRTSDNEPTDNEQTDNEQTDHEMESTNKDQHAAIDLIGVMTKMTLLVTLAVFVSVIGVIGNVFIEIQEMTYIEQHDIAIEELWADILPVIDILITSLMLYLQFNFTHHIYRFFLRRLDVWFLTNCLKFIECLWRRKFNDKTDEKKASFLVENSTRTKTLELVTKEKEEIP